MIEWAKVLLGLIKLFGALVSYLDTKQLLAAGGMQTVAAALMEQANGIRKAEEARQKVRADAARNPAGVLRDNDGWKRK